MSAYEDVIDEFLAEALIDSFPRGLFGCEISQINDLRTPWEIIADKYHELLPRHDYQSPRNLMDRWLEIKDDIEEFDNIFNRVEQDMQPLDEDDDPYEEAVNTYIRTFGENFEGLMTWCALRKNAYWKDFY